MFLEPFYPIYDRLRSSPPELAEGRVIRTSTGKIIVVYTDLTYSIYAAVGELVEPTKYPEPMELYEAGLIGVAQLQTYQDQYANWLSELSCAA